MKTFIKSFWLLTLALLVACQANTPHNSAQQNPATKDAKKTASVTGHGISDAHRQAYIAELDEDGDARVTQAEMEAFRKSRFDDADVNRNGLIDEDADGTVKRAEFDRHRKQAFAATDIDSTGDLSAGEYHIEFETRLDRQADRVREAQIKQAYVRFGVLDKNKDEVIDWNEYLTIGLRGFERWDLDKNGVVESRDPLPAPRVARKEEAKPAGKKSADDAY